jgi:hypothetical protein
MSAELAVGAFLVVWGVLTFWVLPRLGVPT